MQLCKLLANLPAFKTPREKRSGWDKSLDMCCLTGVMMMPWLSVHWWTCATRFFGWQHKAPLQSKTLVVENTCSKLTKKKKHLVKPWSGKEQDLRHDVWKWTTTWHLGGMPERKKVCTLDTFFFLSRLFCKLLGPTVLVYIEAHCTLVLSWEAETVAKKQCCGCSSPTVLV